MEQQDLKPGSYMYSLPDWAYAKKVEIEKRKGELLVVFPEPLPYVTPLWNIPSAARFEPAAPLQAYIFNRMLYGNQGPVHSAYSVTILAYSKGEAWTYLLDEDGHGVQSDWDGPEVKPVQPGILTSFTEE